MVHSYEVQDYTCAWIWCLKDSRKEKIFFKKKWVVFGEILKDLEILLKIMATLADI